MFRSSRAQGQLASGYGPVSAQVSLSDVTSSNPVLSLKARPRLRPGFFLLDSAAYWSEDIRESHRRMQGLARKK